MLKPICVPCQRFFRMKKGGFYFTEGMPINGSRYPEPGAANAHLWKPYKVWAGDLWECHGCGAQIVSGFGLQPLSEHYKDDFEQVRSSWGADQFQVNDC